MKTKIAHISDLHLDIIQKKPKISYKFQNRVLEQICGEKPDAIVITGDLVTYSSEENFEIAVDFINKLSDRFPTLCVPGNMDYALFYPLRGEGDSLPQKSKRIGHFMKGEEQLLIKSFTPFKKIVHISPEKEPLFFRLPYIYAENEDDYYGFAVYSGQVEDDRIESLAFYEDFIGEGEPSLKINNLNLIGFNSQMDINLQLLGNVETNLPHNVFLTSVLDGRLGPQHLEEKTKDLDSDPGIAFMHHPIFPIPGANTRLGKFGQGESVAKQLLEKNICISLCGHKHIQGYRKKTIDIGGEKTRDFHVCAAGTLFDWEIKEPYDDNSYNIVSIDDNNVSVSYKEIRTGYSELLAKFTLE